MCAKLHVRSHKSLSYHAQLTYILTKLPNDVRTNHGTLIIVLRNT